MPQILMDRHVGEKLEAPCTPSSDGELQPVGRAWPIPLLKGGLDTCVLASALVAAFFLRFEGNVPPSWWASLRPWIPVVLVLKLSSFFLFGITRQSWRHVGLQESRRICVALIGVTAGLGVWRLLFADLVPALAKSMSSMPMGVLLIDLVLGFLGVIGLRVAVRSWAEWELGSYPWRRQKVRTLLVGAGKGGTWMAREITSRADVDITPVGFLDDDPTKKGMFIHGVPVLGRIDQLLEVAERHRVEQVLITIAQSGGGTVRRIAQLAEKGGLVAKIIPQLEDVIQGKVELSRIREVAIEDLLRREPVQLDGEAVREKVEGRVVMVTGAGGSIGSQLCHEIARFAPGKILLVEKSENSLFHIHRHLHSAFPGLEVVQCLVNICDDTRMRRLFQEFHPEIVFHAAAHKHVPMMELHPGAAIKNNIWGTRMLADLAHAYEVGEFVMISTDKAVNPTSVMGVSKRVAELYIQALSQRSETRFVTVRFGNVLGSNGSVIPIFKEQIARGGPVTVTHPEMKRFFMTIPEACQLVLQSASMGQQGEILILDMGEPVKIVDLARDLIHLSGVHGEIEIQFTGVRKGEKLYEELAFAEEQAEKTAHPRIFVGRVKSLGWKEINQHLEDLREMADSENLRVIYAKLKEVVPEYRLPAPEAAERTRTDGPSEGIQLSQAPELASRREGRPQSGPHGKVVQGAGGR